MNLKKCRPGKNPVALSSGWEGAWTSRCGFVQLSWTQVLNQDQRAVRSCFGCPLPEDQDFFRIELEPVGSPNIPIVELSLPKRVVTPFVPTRDLSYGLLRPTRALFSYMLMLAAVSASHCRQFFPWVPL
ncbi:hypothetical protein BDM02DRAFT_880213 [Thelephora ganbajun]|uniref:Uncharacterized protein n=1 Tax=Thelephora ganbajun TaxID=370292 RepID=A0ACB6Z4M0_THEGA|nr:hypothetical protein BDM02DRAFT_880213 [Thelephora ganbajun]